MTQKINIENYLKSKAGAFENWLNDLLSNAHVLNLGSSFASVSKILADSMNYSLLAGGKRLRPVFAMSSWDMLNELKSNEVDKDTTDGNKDEADFKANYKYMMPLAVALEMIHTYSLIHDDLPCMDDDDLRRGKPTNHKVYGEAVAVLAGDALLTEAFNQLSSLCEYHHPRNVCELISYLSTASGAQGMVGGQVLDIENAGNKKIDLEYLKQTSYCKTGALIRASVAGPAVLLSQGKPNDKKLISDLEGYGTAIGLAFQIVDDVLGVTSTKEKLGKSVNIDDANNKITFASLLGVDGAKKLAKEEVDKAKDFLGPYSAKAEVLLALSDYITRRSF